MAASSANPFDAYATAVTAGRRLAGKYHLAGCRRHLEDRQREGASRFPYVFDVDRAAKAVRFFGGLRHYKGEWAGQPIRLEPWQQFIVGSVFGWVHQETGLRRFRKTYAEVPRKNGKSLLAAGIALRLTFFDGEPGAEGYCAATKRDQAKIVFGDAKRLVQTSGLKSRIDVHVANLHRDATACKLEPLSADHDSMDGLNVHACILDEFHAQKDRGIVDVIETAMGARRQPHLFAITTAGSDPLSPCGEEHDYACKVLDRVITDETFFAFLAHADVGDDTTPGDDPFATRTHRKANPNYGVSVKPEDLKALATKAKHMPSALASFKQKRLNIWTTAATPWLNLERWKAGQSDWDSEELLGRPCWGGVDLSSKTDLSAFVLVFPPDEGRERWRLLPWFFTPEDGLAERAHQARAPYQRWVDEEYLTTNTGNRIDQSVIKAAILEAASLYDVQCVGFDPWNIGNLATDLIAELGEDRVVEVPQNITQLTEPSKEFEAEVGAGRMDAAGHPVLTWNVSNAVVMRDSNDNIRPTKDPKKSRGRIDGMVAAIMGLKLARGKGSETASVYETRGLVTV